MFAVKTVDAEPRDSSKLKLLIMTEKYAGMTGLTELFDTEAKNKQTKGFRFSPEAFCQGLISIP